MRRDVARGRFLECERRGRFQCGLLATGLAGFDRVHALLAKAPALARLDPRICKGQSGKRAKAHLSGFAVQRKTEHPRLGPGPRHLQIEASPIGVQAGLQGPANLQCCELPDCPRHVLPPIYPQSKRGLQWMVTDDREQKPRYCWPYSAACEQRWTGVHNRLAEREELETNILRVLLRISADC